MKQRYTILIAVIILIINAIIVYFGRIYFPKNFSPETVTFFENYWVLTLGLCFFVALTSVCIIFIWFIGIELIKDVKSLFRKT